MSSGSEGAQSCIALWEFNPAALSVTSAASLLSFNAIVNVTAPL